MQFKSGLGPAGEGKDLHLMVAILSLDAIKALCSVLPKVDNMEALKQLADNAYAVIIHHMNYTHFGTMQLLDAAELAQDIRREVERITDE